MSHFSNRPLVVRESYVLTFNIYYKTGMIDISMIGIMIGSNLADYISAMCWSLKCLIVLAQNFREWPTDSQ